MGDRSGVHQGGRDEDPGRLGRDPAGHAAVDLRDSRVPGRPPRAFAEPTLDAIEAAPIDNPGTTQAARACPGVQYVGIPEFQDVGNQCTEQFSAVIAGRSPIDSALEELPGHRVPRRALT